MNDEIASPRRRFLIGLTAMAVVWTVPSRSIHQSTEIAEYLDHFFREGLAGAVALGRKYLEKEQSERSQSFLTTLVFGADLEDSDVDIRALTARVRHDRDRDFLRGDLVAVDGWLLARTEARLCALTALAVRG